VVEEIRRYDDKETEYVVFFESMCDPMESEEDVDKLLETCDGVRLLKGSELTKVGKAEEGKRSYNRYSLKF